MKWNLFFYNTFRTPSILEHFKINDLETASAVMQQLFKLGPGCQELILVKGGKY